MSQLSDRLLLLLISVVAFGTLIVAWIGGLVEAGIGGFSETAIFAGLGVLLVLVLIGIWFEAAHLDKVMSRFQ